MTGMGSTDAVLYAEQGSHQLDIPSAVPLPSVNVMLKSIHEVFVATDRLSLSSVGCKINSEHVANGKETYDATLAISLQCNLFLFIMHPNRALARGCAACHRQAVGMFEYCNSMTPYQQLSICSCCWSTPTSMTLVCSARQKTHLNNADP